MNNDHDEFAVIAGPGTPDPVDELAPGEFEAAGPAVEDAPPEPAVLAAGPAVEELPVESGPPDDEPSEPLDPFEAWPQPQTGEVIEDVPDEAAGIEHVSGEIDVPDGYTVLEGTPTGHRRSASQWSSRASTAASRTACSRVRSRRSKRPGSPLTR